MSDENCFEKNGKRITVEYFFNCMHKWSKEQDEKRTELADDIKGHVSEVVEQVGKRIDDSNIAIGKTDKDLKEHIKEDRSVRLYLTVFCIVVSVLLFVVYPAALAYAPLIQKVLPFI